MAISPLMKSAYAGLLTASNMVVANQLRQRGPLAVTSRRYLPVGVQALPELLDYRLDAGNEPQRAARVTTAAMLKTLEPGSPYALQGGFVDELLSGDERERLDLDVPSLDDFERELQAEDGGLCRYCTLFEELFHEGKPSPIAVVNHGANIDTDFSLKTNISEARIDDYQLLLPKRLVDEAIAATHPLYWQEAAPAFFEETAPAERGRKPSGQPWECHSAGKTGDGPEEWQALARRDVAHLYERAVWPWNERITTRVENVLRIEQFVNATAEASAISARLRDGDPSHSIAERAGGFRAPNALEARFALVSVPPSAPGVKGGLVGGCVSANEARILHYKYSLESCVRSTYGLGWEDFNGLNVDDGTVSNLAVHYSQLTESHVQNLTVRDLKHLRLTALRTAAARGKEHSPFVEEEGDAIWKRYDQDGSKVGYVRAMAKLLGQLWPEKHKADPDDVWFLCVSASKRIRFSLPLNGPPQVWSALTWMAPAILLTFLNTAVCQLPHTLHKAKDLK